MDSRAPIDTMQGFVASLGDDPAAKPPPPAKATKGGDFLAAYRPISYTVGGILPSGYFYGLTARRGGGKTAYLIAATCAKVTGDRSILGCEIEPGRVAYITKENPDDFRMKLAVNCHLHGIDHKLANEMILVLDGRTDTPEAICERLRVDSEENGQFGLINYDTFQAGFAASGGLEFNNNAEVLKFVLRLRPMTEIIGNPPCLLAFHPTKNAGEDELFPYGGGAIMNEIDGNLTLWAEAPYQIKLHWNRVRGPEFEPQYFRIERLSSPDIVDIKGAQILLPVLRTSSHQNVEDRQKQEANKDLALLRAMAANPDWSQGDLAKELGCSKSTVNGKLQSLKNGKFVEEGLGHKWRLTPKGMKEAEKS